MDSLIETVSPSIKLYVMSTFCFKMNVLLMHEVFSFHVPVYSNIIPDYSLMFSYWCDCRSNVKRKDS